VLADVLLLNSDQPSHVADVAAPGVELPVVQANGAAGRRPRRLRHPMAGRRHSEAAVLIVVAGTGDSRTA
jgi:hypothetical protein